MVVSFATLASENVGYEAQARKALAGFFNSVFDLAGRRVFGGGFAILSWLGAGGGERLFCFVRVKDFAPFTIGAIDVILGRRGFDS